LNKKKKKKKKEKETLTNQNDGIQCCYFNKIVVLVVVALQKV